MTPTNKQRLLQCRVEAEVDWPDGGSRQSSHPRPPSPSAPTMRGSAVTGGGGGGAGGGGRWRWSVVGNGRWTVDGGRWTVDGGRWTVDGGRWTVDGGRWAMDGGRWAMDDGPADGGGGGGDHNRPAAPAGCDLGQSDTGPVEANAGDHRSSGSGHICQM